MNTLKTIDMLLDNLYNTISSLSKYSKQKSSPQLWERTSNGKKHLILARHVGKKVKQQRIKYDSLEAKDTLYAQMMLRRLSVLQRNYDLLSSVRLRLSDDGMEPLIEWADKKYSLFSKEYIIDTISAKAITENYHTKIDILSDMPYDKYENKSHRTSRGLFVRSKSELLIAEKLYEYEIDFEYEPLFKLGTTNYSPDFLIRRNGKVYVWEHFGLVNNKEYLNQQLKKITRYIESGIVPWDNLIITFDDANGHIDVAEIDFRIRQKFM